LIYSERGYKGVEIDLTVRLIPLIPEMQADKGIERIRGKQV